MNSSNLSKAVCTVLLVAGSLIAQSPKPAQLPDSAAGRRVAAYIAAFNSGNEQTMRDFITNNVAPTALQQRPIEARLDVYRQMHGNMGGLEVRRVLEAQDSAVKILALTKQNEWFEIGFQFESAPPYKLLGIRVEDAEPPSATAAAESSPAVITEGDLIANVDKYLSDAVAAEEFSGTVLIAKKNSPVFQKAYGLASREYNVANRIDTRFNLGSINKIFTQVAIGQLAEQGKLTFDDKLAKHLPDFPNREAAEKITIRQLLDMSSGIGDFFGPDFEATPKDKLRTIGDFMALFAKKPLLFEPGTKTQYSNGGYVVLGAIVEKISGRDYYQYVRENIFKPADMRDTDWYEADLTTPNLASGYTSERTAGRAESTRRNNIYSRPARGSSAGGGYSTAPDLLKFATALQEGKLRVPDFRRAGNSGARTTGSTGTAFGGLGIAGGAPGINAVLEVGGEQGYTVVVMSNYDPPSAERVAKQIRGWTSKVKS